MNNLSTITDMSSQIGALELDDHLADHDDSVLEAAVESPGNLPTMPRLHGGNC
jgi:hypothetical protein